MRLLMGLMMLVDSMTRMESIFQIKLAKAYGLISKKL